MLNANLTTMVIASLKAAGITTPELTPIRPFPKSRASIEDLTEILIASEYEDPYEDPKAISIASQLYIQSLGMVDQGHRVREMERRAAELEGHKEALVQQLQEAFNSAAENLIENAGPVLGMEDPATLDVRTVDRGTALAATNTTQALTALENIIKAWSDLWLALGNSYGRDRGKPYTFMNPDAREWDKLRNNPTVWEAVRNGVALTLADSPEHVSRRYQAMINNEQAATEARDDATHPNYLPAGGYPQLITFN